MFAVGHMSVAYLLTRGLKRGRWKSMSIPLVWTCAMLPDLDLLIPGVRHMGPTHSIIFAIAAFLPLFIYKRDEVLPYFLGYASHSILGDFITNYGTWLFWPLTEKNYSISLPFAYRRTFSMNLELTLFGLFVLVFILTKDYAKKLYSSSTRPLFIIPFMTLLVPLISGFPSRIQLPLIPPHLILMAIILQPLYPPSLKAVLRPGTD